MRVRGLAAANRQGPGHASPVASVSYTDDFALRSEVL